MTLYIACCEDCGFWTGPYTDPHAAVLAATIHEKLLRKHAAYVDHVDLAEDLDVTDEEWSEMERLMDALEEIRGAP
jgi:hypothetical protein